MRASSIAWAVAVWALLFIGGLAVGEAEQNAAPIIRTESVNWDAIAALASVAGGLALLNWFTIRQAVTTAVLASELKIRAELDAYVTKEFCKSKHWDTERRVEILEEQTLRGRNRHSVDQAEDNRRLNELEDFNKS